MSDQDDQQEHGWGLIMPFVCCATNGGAFEDHAFVAGVKYGALDRILDIEKPDEWQGYMPPELVGQCDLAAMHYGYTMTAEPWEEAPDEHVLVTLTKLGRVSPDAE